MNCYGDRVPAQPEWNDLDEGVKLLEPGLRLKGDEKYLIEAQRKKKNKKKRKIEGFVGHSQVMSFYLEARNCRIWKDHRDILIQLYIHWKFHSLYHSMDNSVHDRYWTETQFS